MNEKTIIAGSSNLAARCSKTRSLSLPRTGRFEVAVAVVALGCAACGGDMVPVPVPVPLPSCEAGESRDLEPCGLNDRGVQRQTCEQGEWSQVFCVDSDACDDGDTGVLTGVCGLNDRGEQTETCVLGQWESDEICNDLDECIDNAERTTPCGLNDRGDLLELCALGAWTANGSCNDPDECSDGATQILSDVCGINGRGDQPQQCSLGQWINDGACDDPDTCLDNTERSGGACGYNSAGRLVETCISGAWSPPAPCDVPSNLQFVADLNTAGTHGISSYTEFSYADGFAVFLAEALGEDGPVLWATDGTEAGTFSLWDIAPPELDLKSCTVLTGLADHVYLSCLYTGMSGPEAGVWAFGYGARTLQLIIAGAISLQPAPAVTAGSLGSEDLYFVSPPTGPDTTLWVTDGTPTGTREVSAYIPAFATFRFGAWLGEVSAGSLFSVSKYPDPPEFWVTDGTAPGTSLVSQLDVDRGWQLDGTRVLLRAEVGGEKQLFRTDGATVERVGTLSGISSAFTSGQGFAVVHASGGLYGTDGTSTELLPFSNAYDPRALGNKLILYSGTDTYVSDGTAAGTQLLASGFRPSVIFDDKAVLTDGGTCSGWTCTEEPTYLVSDGTPGGTVAWNLALPGVVPGDQNILVRVGDALYVIRNGQVWGLSSLLATPQMLVDSPWRIRTTGALFGQGGGDLDFPHWGLLLPIASEAEGLEPWLLSGGSVQAHLVKDIDTATANSFAGPIGTCAGIGYLITSPAPDTFELWAVDSNLSTERLATWDDDRRFGWLECSGTTAFFNCGLAFEEIWMTEGTPASTQYVMSGPRMWVLENGAFEEESLTRIAQDGTTSVLEAPTGGAFAWVGALGYAQNHAYFFAGADDCVTQECPATVYRFDGVTPEEVTSFSSVDRDTRMRGAQLGDGTILAILSSTVECALWRLSPTKEKLWDCPEPNMGASLFSNNGDDLATFHLAGLTEQFVVTDGSVSETREIIFEPAPGYESTVCQPDHSGPSRTGVINDRIVTCVGDRYWRTDGTQTGTSFVDIPDEAPWYLTEARGDPFPMMVGLTWDREDHSTFSLDTPLTVYGVRPRPTLEVVELFQTVSLNEVSNTYPWLYLESEDVGPEPHGAYSGSTASRVMYLNGHVLLRYWTPEYGGELWAISP